MKGMMKKTAILLATALICFFAYGGYSYAAPGDTGTTDDGFKYVVNDDGETVTVTGFAVPDSYAPGQVLRIPDTVNVGGTNMRVTLIGENAFRILDDNGLKKCKWTGLVLPAYLEEIKDYAFFKNEHMTGELLIPNSVRVIGNSAFASCENFTELTLSTALTEIGGNAFENCTGLSGELRLPTTLTSIGNEAFRECYSLSGELKIPNTTAPLTIGSRAFQRCTGFDDLTIPGTVTSIGERAFADMFMDGTLIVGAVTTIGNYAFEHSYFKSIDNHSAALMVGAIFGSNTDTAYRFFSYQGVNPGDAVIETTFPDETFGINKFERRFYSNGYYNGYSTMPTYYSYNGFIYRIEDDKAILVYYDNLASQSLQIPDTLGGKPVTKITKGAFAKCSGFTGTLTLPDGLTEIEEYAFYQCSGLSGGITIPEGVTQIGMYAFFGCSGFDGELSLGSNITELDLYCFGNCSGLKGNVSIPSGCAVYANVFRNCENLSGELTIPGVYTYIDNWAFYGTSFGKIINNSTKNIEVECILKTLAERYYFDDANGERVDTIGQGSYTLLRSITDAAISFKKGTVYTYEGAEIKPEIEVKIGKLVLEAGKDYTLVYKDCNAVGTATVEVSGVGGYYGRISARYTIAATTEVAAIDPIADRIYTGKAQCPEITFGGVRLERGKDYLAVYSNNINAGTASVTAIGRNTYTFYLDATFKILPASLDDAVVADIAPQTYTGEEIKPAVTITVSDNTLVADRDYTLTYKDNIDKETATVTATGKGNYTGSVSKEFKISGISDKADTDENNEEKEPETPHSTMTPLVVVPEIMDKTDAIYMVKGQKFTLPDGNWEIKDNINKTVNLKKGVLTAKKVGTAKIAKGTQNITVKVIQPKFAEKSWTEEAGREITLALDGFDKEHYGILWSSSNVDVATVSGNGIVKTLSKGTATITAYVNGKTYSCKLKVTESTIVAERTLHINIGTPKPLKIAGVKNPAWEVVSGNAVIQGKNKVSAKTAGTSKLLAKTSDGKSYVVYVIAEDIGISAAGLEDKGKNKYNLQLAPKGTTQISFKGVERQIIWKSSSPEKAYVDENGVVHALKEGKCKFTTKVNGKNITINVVVK